MGEKGASSSFSEYEFSLSALTFLFQLNAYSTKTLTFKQAAYPAYIFILQADHFSDRILLSSELQPKKEFGISAILFPSFLKNTGRQRG